MRRLSWCFLGLCLVAGPWAQAQWNESGQPVAETDWQKSVDGMGVFLALTDDLEGFMGVWESTPESEAPAFRDISRVSRGESVGLLLFFAVNEDFAGVFGPVVSYRVLRPDGTVYADMPYSSATEPGTPTPGVQYLSNALLKIDIDPEDPLGVYAVEANFKQNSAADPIALKRTFTVEEAQPKLDFDAFFEGYYRDPQPDMVGAALAFAGANIPFDNEQVFAPLVAFFVEVFADNPERMPEWLAVIDQLPEKARQALKLAAVASSDPDKMFAGIEPSPMLNDLCWGAFFASGDQKYLSRLMAQVSHLDEREDLNLYLSAVSAKWSLASNLRTHDAVKAAIEAAVGSAEGAHAKDLQDILVVDPARIWDEAEAVVRAQREKGLWK